jgi:hypothetical protein
MLKKSCLIIIVLLAAGVFSVSAQSKVDAAVTRLTGGNSKQWVRDRIEIFMGNKRKCTQGEKWKFFKTGTVSVTKCIKGQWVQEPAKSWSVAASGLDLTLTAGSESYTLILPPDKPREMTLRKKSPRIATQTVDLVFRYEVD